MTMDIKNQGRKYRPLVYVCSAYSGDVTANREKTIRYCRFAIEKGQIPLAPNLLFPNFINDADPNERDLALFMDVVLLGKCDELWVFGETISAGMALEIGVAKKRRQTIRYFDSRMKEMSIYEHD